MKNKLALACIVFLITQTVFAQLSLRETIIQEEALVPPILLKKEALQAGNPLATYAAMLDLEPQYLKSRVFADFYREIRFNLEEFMGFPLAGVQAMSLPTYRRQKPSVETSVETPLPKSYRAES